MIETLNSPEKRAAEELSRAIQGKMDGLKAIEIAAMAMLQAQMANAALQGLIELLAHKNVISTTDLSQALKHAYNRAHDQIIHGTRTREPDSVIARPQ